MKKHNLFGFLHKKEEPEKVPVYGITLGEYRSIMGALDAELGAAAARQRPGALSPSAYMRGLLFAIKLIEATKPHNVGVQP